MAPPTSYEYVEVMTKIRYTSLIIQVRLNAEEGRVFNCSSMFFLKKNPTNSFAETYYLCCISSKNSSSLEESLLAC